MLYQHLYRDPDHSPVHLTTFVMDAIPGTIGGEIRPAVIVCPGGGYCHLSPREAENMAVWLNANGFHAFVLYYTIVEPEKPAPLGKQPLLDLSWAVATVRAHAQEWNVDPDKIAVMGSSAGAHLAGSLGVFWQEDFCTEQLGLPKGSNRPNALILNYAVLIEGPHSHRGSLVNLMGKDAEDRFHEFSLEKHVSDQTPPAFIWHTWEDAGVPVENSLQFAQAMREHHRPFELHIFETGGHGISTCQADVAVDEGGINPATGKWMELCITWLKRLFQMR